VHPLPSQLNLSAFEVFSGNVLGASGIEPKVELERGPQFELKRERRVRPLAAQLERLWGIMLGGTRDKAAQVESERERRAARPRRRSLGRRRGRSR